MPVNKTQIHSEERIRSSLQTIWQDLQSKILAHHVPPPALTAAHDSSLLAPQCAAIIPVWRIPPSPTRPKTCARTNGESPATPFSPPSPSPDSKSWSVSPPAAWEFFR